MRKPFSSKTKLVSALLVGGVLFALFSNYTLWGWLRGEPAFEGKPVCYWRDVLLRIKDSNPYQPSVLDLVRAKVFGIQRYDCPVLERDDPMAVPVLMALLRDRDPWIRREGAIALGRITSGPDAFIPALDDAMQDQDAHVRVDAAYALWKTNSHREKALSTLVEELRQENGRGAALHRLDQIGPAANAAVPILMELVKDKDSYHRSTAAECLKHIDPEAAAEAGVQ